MNKVYLVIVSVLLTWASFCLAEDGTYDAVVTTDSGSYTVPVEVEDGEVTSVDWPNGGDMTVSGAEISDDGEATGYNSRGETVQIEIEDYESESEETEE
jgi:hypothetical protein